MMARSAPLESGAYDETDSPAQVYAHALKRQWWVIVLVAVVAVAGAFAVLSLQEKVYSASTILVLGSPGETPETEETETVSTLFRSEAVAAGVIRRLNLDLTTKELLGRFSAESRSAGVIHATYEAASPEAAERGLGVFTAVFIQLLEQRFGVDPEITIFNAPRAEPQAVSPRVMTTLVFAGVLGIAVGILVAVLRETLNNKIRSRRDAEESFGAPVIGALPKGWRQGPSAIMSTEKRGRALQRALMMLSADIEPTKTGERGLAIVVTSMRPEEGKAAIAANLGVLLAREGLSIVCVEADASASGLHRYLPADGDAPGLLDVAKGTVDLGAALASVSFDGVPPANGNGAGNGFQASGSLRVMALGEHGTNGSNMLTDKQVGGLLDRLRASADVSIVDASPLGVGEALPFVRESDRVMLVARAGETTRAMAADARATLERLGTRDVGVILVDADKTQLFL